jgi:Lar family restriction alleviation protein
MKQLSPCPFCGGKAKIIDCEEESNTGGRVVACKKCEACSIVMFPLMDSVDDMLTQAWNRRTSPRQRASSRKPHGDAQ